jgi:hypothetical protein
MKHFATKRVLEGVEREEREKDNSTATGVDGHSIRGN